MFVGAAVALVMDPGLHFTVKVFVYIAYGLPELITYVVSLKVEVLVEGAVVMLNPEADRAVSPAKVI